MDVSIVITKTALEKARALHPPLAVMGDHAARAALAAHVAAGSREHTRDHRSGQAQDLVALGGAADADAAPWGFAICKDDLVVTVVDADARRYLLARGRRPASPPQLRRVAAEGHELARYAVGGVPAVAVLIVAPDGTVGLVGEDGRVLP